jgi:hypothetical protein
MGRQNDGFQAAGHLAGRFGHIAAQAAVDQHTSMRRNRPNVALIVRRVHENASECSLPAQWIKGVTGSTREFARICAPPMLCIAAMRA